MLGNVLYLGDAFHQPIIVGAFFDENTEARIGDCCTGITGQSAQNFVVALFYQPITDRFADLIASSDSKQIFLPFYRYAMGKSIVVQCAGLRENRLGDLDRIVESERADCIGGRAV